jgi:hypothetical protein
MTYWNENRSHSCETGLPRHIERAFDYHQMMAAYVKLAIPPHRADLVCWGSVAQSWWGLVVWTESVDHPGRVGGPGALICAGWTAARDLQRLRRANYNGIPRVELPGDASLWPGPGGMPDVRWPDNGVYLGILTGAPYALPKGYVAKGRALPNWPDAYES